MKEKSLFLINLSIGILPQKRDRSPGQNENALSILAKHKPYQYAKGVFIRKKPSTNGKAFLCFSMEVTQPFYKVCRAIG